MVKNVLRMLIANLINADNHEKRLDTYNTTDDLRHRCINIKTTHTQRMFFTQCDIHRKVWVDYKKHETMLPGESKEILLCLWAPQFR